MKKIINIFLVIFTIFSVISLNNIDVKADNNLSGGSCDTYYVVNSKGEKYCVPRSVIGTPAETDYKNVVETGRLTAKDRELFIKIGNDYKNNDYINRVKNTFDYIASGTAGKSTEGYFKCILNGKGVWNFEKGYNGCNLDEKGGAYLVDTGYRNYYKNLTDTNVINNNTTNNNTTINNYRDGDTYNTRIINMDNRTLKYYDNSTKNYITTNFNNYYYNIYDNKYFFETNFNETYVITNNFDNTTVNIFGSGGSIHNKYYFALPDGTSSYNMTEENMKGFTLDYNFKLYDNLSDNPDNILGLFHFEQSQENSANNKNLTVNFTNPSVSYMKDSDTNFDNYLVLSGQQGRMIIPYTEDIKSIDFRIKPIFTNEFRLGFLNWEFVKYKQNNTTTTYIDKEIVTKTRYDVKVPNTCGADKIVGYSYTNDVVVGYTCEKSIVNNQKVPVVNNNVIEKFEEHGNILNYGMWNHIAITDINAGLGNLWVNGKLVEEGIPVIDDTMRAFRMGYISSSLIGIDELRVLKNNVYTKSFTPSTTPYDTDNIYVLPDVEENNTVLVKSTIPITSTQVGGKRKSNPVRGDIFVFVGDLYNIVSVQQYNGSDWIEVDASYYSTKFNKWIKINGLMVKGELQTFPNDDQSGSSGGASEQFLKEYFEKILRALSLLKISTNVEKGTNFWDSLISMFDNFTELVLGFPESIAKLINSLTNLIKTLFVPSENFFENWKEKSFKSPKLASYSKLFDDTKIIFTVFDTETVNNSNLPDLFSWNDISLNGVVVIQGGSFSFTRFLNNYQYMYSLYNSYLTVVDIIIILLLLKFIYTRLLAYLNK